MTKKQLIIVESPAKAKTIGGFLGKDYIVKSSFGHIRDLPKKGLNIDIENNFKPTYDISADKKKIVSELKKIAATSDTVWLATDEDREGEAIAWHLSEALKLKPANTKRIAFHEITKTAIEQAINNPRQIDNNLVDAQQARRILDRLVGYELSPILWRKIQPKLSAGRVQSIAVRIIVEREREVKAFQSKSSFKTTALMKFNKEEFNAELDFAFKDEKAAQNFLEDCKKVSYLVSNVSAKPATRNPSPPFTTSSLQQEAARKLGFSVKQTMTLAQKLYENGHITYMRTDSLNLSNLALQAAAKYIAANYGDKYYKERHYHTKDSSAQEAHEAIRPTNLNNNEAGADSGQQKLYKLIWRRTLASQMSPAQTIKTVIAIDISDQKHHFVASGEVLQFDGYIKVYGGGKEDAILPKLAIGDKPEALSISAKQTYSRPPARYSEASLVKRLEELGIGRPSTYAPTISTIQSRGYIEKGDLEGSERPSIVITLKDNKITQEVQTEKFGADKNKLLPTHLADVTTDFLVKYFDKIIENGFTAEIEKQFDKIAEGQIVWQDIIKNFYKHFHPLIGKANSASRQETSQARLLGLDPASKQPIYARYGRYGPMLQKGEAIKDSKDKPAFAPMPAGIELEDVSLDEALKMFQLPREVGETADGQAMTANIGRFGPYIKINKEFVSIKPLDPFTITEAQAREMYQKKLDAIADRHIKQFDNSKIQIIKGPYGPYITDGHKNAPVPKTSDPAKLTLKEAEELLAKSKPGKKRFTRKPS
jgi:DNA topoisomerase-1